MTTTVGVVGRRAGSEVAWLARAVLRLVRFLPGAVLVWLGLGLVGAVLLGEMFAAAWATVALLLLIVGRLWPSWLDAQVADRVRRRRIRQHVMASWDEVRTGAGLPDGMGLQRRPQWAGSDLMLRPAIPCGVTVEDIEKTTDRLAAGLRAVRVRVSSNCPGEVQIAARFTDALELPFEAVVPPVDAPVVWDRVPIGLREDGKPWEWSIRVSTLTAGASGSGKGSLLWGLVIGLGPAVKAGLVKLHGVDLKGGMELAMGRGLFDRVAVTPEDATVLLVDTAEDLRSRARGLAGVTRQHQPTAESPQVVIVVDELAALVAYADRKERERAEAALNVILSQGRAVGFTVMAFVQDPKKEVVRNRGLFPTSLGLRLRGREEVAMVLGDGARAGGAVCDRIPLSMPGTGYVLADGEASPVRVRAGYVTDDAIRLAADRFGTPPPIFGNQANDEATDDQVARGLSADRAGTPGQDAGEESADETAGPAADGQPAADQQPSMQAAAAVLRKSPRRRGGANRAPRAMNERTPSC